MGGGGGGWGRVEEERVVRYCQRKSNNLINRIHERALRIAYNEYDSNFNQLLEKG